MIAGALSLAQLHLATGPSHAGGPLPHVPSKAQLWSYLCQLAAALRAVHGAGLALRPGGLAASKVRRSCRPRANSSRFACLACTLLNTAFGNALSVLRMHSNNATPMFTFFALAGADGGLWPAAAGGAGRAGRSCG